jgi:hypothetical protein
METDKLPFDLRREIVGLLNVHHGGQLGDLLTQHATECRERQLPLDSQLSQPVEPTASEVARAAKQLLGCSEAEARAIACDELKHHPRRDLAVELIGYFLGDDSDEHPAPAVPDGPKPVRRQRAW